jgi:polyisoprenoid-binding protein YceI
VKPSAKLKLIALLGATSLCLADAAEIPIDIGHSTLRIHVGKSGLFSAAGHEHWVTAPVDAGSIEQAGPAHVSFRVEAARLAVESDKDLSSSQQAEIQSTMQARVLDSSHYPEISFRSTSIEETSAGNWLVKGDLSLHGLSTTVHKEGDAYVGRCQIKQTDFGISPITVAGGTVKVKNEVQIEFSILPSHASTP